MDTVIYVAARILVALIQALPLRWVARLGRLGGGLTYWLDGRHRRVALSNLNLCFGKEKSAREIRDIARENFRRIGESYACAIKTADMSNDELRPFVECSGDLSVLSQVAGKTRGGTIGAVGHFGNFELYARLGMFHDGARFATTYRSLRPESLNRILLSLRKKSGCLYFERRTEAAQLRAAMNQPGTLLGLLADQNAGRPGLRLPFLGHECSTTAAPALFALRYHCRLYTAVIFRTGLARWRLEVGREIPLQENGQNRTPAAIMRDVNAAFEAAVLRDPANWFWVHNRWKPSKPGKRTAESRQEEGGTTSGEEEVP